MLNGKIYLCLADDVVEYYLCYHNTDTDVYIGVAYDPRAYDVAQEIEDAMISLKNLVPFCDNSMTSVQKDIEKADLVAEVNEGKLCLK